MAAHGISTSAPDFAVIFFGAAYLIFLGSNAVFFGLILLLTQVFIPIIQYRALAKAVDNDRIWTDPKTLDFSSSQLVSTGPNWKIESPWTRFKGSSEDADYFYLHISDNGIAAVIPKSAFSAEQQQKFRQYAQVLTP